MAARKIIGHSKSIASVANPGLTKRQWLLGAAWFFIGFSLLRLILAIGTVSASPGEVTSLISGGGFEAPLLTYTGALGLSWAWLQTVGLAIAAAASILPIKRIRRIGHGLLLGWSALWLGNFLMLTSADGGLASFAQTGLMTCLFGCTIYRAWTAGRPGLTFKRSKPVVEVEPQPALQPEPDPFAFDIAAEQAIHEGPVTSSKAAAWKSRVGQKANEGQVWWHAKARPTLGKWSSTATDHVIKAWHGGRRLARRTWKRLRDGQSSPTTQPQTGIGV